MPGAKIAPPRHRYHRSTIDEALDEVIVQQIGEARHFKVHSEAQSFDIAVEVHDGVLRMIVPRDRVTVSSPDRSSPGWWAPRSFC